MNSETSHQSNRVKLRQRCHDRPVFVQLSDVFIHINFLCVVSYFYYFLLLLWKHYYQTSTCRGQSQGDGQQFQSSWDEKVKSTEQQHQQQR